MKKTINFTVSTSSNDPDEAVVARYLIEGIAIDEDKLDVKKGKALVFYALKYLALKKSVSSNKKSMLVVKEQPIIEEKKEVEKPKATSGLTTFFAKK